MDDESAVDVGSVLVWLIDKLTDVAGAFIAGAAGAIVGAAVGALLSYWAAMDLRRRDAESRSAERELNARERAIAASLDERHRMREAWARTASSIAVYDHRNVEDITDLLVRKVEITGLARTEPDRALARAVRDLVTHDVLAHTDLAGKVVGTIMMRVEEEWRPVEGIVALLRRWHAEAAARKLAAERNAEAGAPGSSSA